MELIPLTEMMCVWERGGRTVGKWSPFAEYLLSVVEASGEATPDIDFHDELRINTRLHSYFLPSQIDIDVTVLRSPTSF